VRLYVSGACSGGNCLYDSSSLLVVPAWTPETIVHLSGHLWLVGCILHEHVLTESVVGNLTADVKAVADRRVNVSEGHDVVAHLVDELKLRQGSQRGSPLRWLAGTIVKSAAASMSSLGMS
jgi:hypothetical protein